MEELNVDGVVLKSFLELCSDATHLLVEHFVAIKDDNNPKRIINISHLKRILESRPRDLEACAFLKEQEEIEHAKSEGKELEEQKLRKNFLLKESELILKRKISLENKSRNELIWNSF